MAKNYDAVLFLSFGGPEGPEDVMPFLENVVRGRNVPRERLEEVAEHYHHFGGVSPINGQNRAIIAALEAELEAHDIDLPVYFGNRNWHPMVEDTVATMASDGVKRALAFATSAYGGYSGCRQYREDIARARAACGDGAPEIDKLRVYFNHPRFVQANVDHVRAALAQFPEGARADVHIAFTAHSIPLSMASMSEYAEQLVDVARMIAEALGHNDYALVYQSRSGPPQVPWLEPDILDHLEEMARDEKTNVIVAPIGFISDHMEVLFDLDTEAVEKAEELGLNMVRAATASTHEGFAAMIRELICERLDEADERPAVGRFGPGPDVCAPDCCAYTPRRPIG